MSSPAPLPRQRKTWDTILSIVLLVFFLGWVVLCAFAGVLIAFAGDSCGASSECNYDQIGAAFMVGTIGPVVVGVLVLVVTIVQLLRKRIAFYLPVIGALLAAGVVAAAFWLATSAVVPIAS
jgi:uncharacterized membrane protein YqaE (UPF0057 family)